jgi:hypothetical protein
MSIAIPPLPQYAFMVWCSKKAQGQLYLYLSPYILMLSSHLLLGIPSDHFPRASLIKIQYTFLVYHIIPTCTTHHSLLHYRMTCTNSHILYYVKGKGTGKVVTITVLFLNEHYAMKAYCGSGGIAPHIIDLSTKWW